MNKDVLISIKGLHFDVSDDPEDLEVFQSGQYYIRGNMHYLIYDEPVEGTDYTTKNMIKFNSTSMTLTKKGVINTSMLFEVAKKNITNYATPFGTLVIGIDTHSIDINTPEDELRLDISYSLDINYEHLSDCNITIIAKNAGDLDI
ncbi:MAG: DUF1934 domain-containing protein [Lachnospiraceae bacterium]|nr:DUF1934 domain-containing protein [Candidatus Colinaster scatohippi]